MITLYVNPNHGNDTAVGSQTAPLKTITSALQRATEGTIIQLTPGLYHPETGETFPLILPQGVTLQGNENNRGQEIKIQGGGEYLSPSFKQQIVTIMMGQSAMVKGIQISNFHEKGTGIWIEDSNPVISHNTLIDCGREGIFVTGKSKPIIENNVLEDNGNSGIFMVRNGKGEIRHNLCQNTGHGIAISDDSAPLISDNQLLDNRIGIYVLRNGKPVLRRNLMEHNENGGLVVAGEAQPDLGNIQDPAGNIFRNNATLDLKNKTKFSLVSVGNDLNPSRIEGTVEFLSTIIHTRWIKGPALFSDIVGHWAELFMDRLVKEGLMTGFPDCTFRPEDKLTRSQYATLIAKAFDLPRQIGSVGDFQDIKPTFWARNAIQKASEMGFISGFPDYTFRPQQPITRVQTIVSLVTGLGLTGSSSNALSLYRDRSEIPSYAIPKVAIATQRGLIVNYPDLDQLHPNREITRGEMSALLYQSLVATGKYPVIESPYQVISSPKQLSFTDIRSHWAEEFIYRLSSLNLVRGFADGSFRPNDSLNRVQYASLIAQIFNPSPLRPPTQFFDIPQDFWGLDAIQKTYQGGFLSGFPDQTFHPEQSLRKVNLIVSLAQGLQLPAHDSKYLSLYQDQDQIPPYGINAVAAATRAGIVVNYPHPSRLNPKQEVTRGEAVAMLYQALVYQHKAIAINSPYLVS